MIFRSKISDLYCDLDHLREVCQDLDQFSGDHITTRFGPNRPAADMEGNSEFDFLGDFWRHS